MHAPTRTSASASNLASLSSLPLPLIAHPDTGDTHPNEDAHNRSCPTCSIHLGELSKEVPGSHNVNSVVVCRISGKVMDDGDQGGGGGPMAFPNGYVYSYGVSRFPSLVSRAKTPVLLSSRSRQATDNLDAPSPSSHLPGSEGDGRPRRRGQGDLPEKRLSLRVR